MHCMLFNFFFFMLSSVLIAEFAAHLCISVHFADIPVHLTLCINGYPDLLTLEQFFLSFCCSDVFKAVMPVQFVKLPIGNIISYFLCKIISLKKSHIFNYTFSFLLLLSSNVFQYIASYMLILIIFS